MIRPVISYASTVWCAGLEKGTCKGILNTIQQKACMAISGAFHSTPTASLEMLVGLLPLDIHIRSVALLSMYRLRQNGLWRDAHIKDTAAHRSHVNLCNQHMQSIACLNFVGDLILPVFYPSLPYSCVIEDSANNEDCTALTCFTDGSKKESGETGAGVHFPRGGMSDISRPLGCYPTVFQAEVLTITLAAERLSEYTESHMTEETIFFSDSRAAIQAVCGSRVRSSSVHRCIEALQTLSTHTNVKIKWTRAHVETAGNECADQLAKLATESPFIGPEPTIPVSYSFCKKQVWNWAWNTFTCRWGGMSTCRGTKELFQNPLDRKGTSKLLQLPRYKMSTAGAHGSWKLCKHLKLTGRWNNHTVQEVSSWSGVEGST